MHQGYEAGLEYEGSVKFWNGEKGYGFCRVDGQEDIFVHVSVIVAGSAKLLEEGQKVLLLAEKGPKGWRASQVVPQ